MTLTQKLTLIVGVIYTLVAMGHLLAGRDGLAIAFGGYALANLGLILAE